MRLTVAALPLMLVAACAQFPDVDAVTDAEVAQAEYPVLLPVEDILPEDQPRLDEDSEGELEARIRRLKRRANDLKSQ